MMVDRWILSVGSTIIIALISALWLNINQEISELKVQVRGLDVAMSDMRMNLMETKERYDKLVDIFNSTATRKR